MAKYINIKTRAVINTDCKMLGDWVLEGTLPSEKIEIVKEIPIEPTEEPEENLADFDGITRAQIMQELDAFGVEYDKRANKQTLYDLMMAQGK